MCFFSSPKNADQDDEPSQYREVLSCLQSATTRKQLRRNRNRTDLLNSLAKFFACFCARGVAGVCPPASPSVRMPVEEHAPAAVGAISPRQGRVGARYSWILVDLRRYRRHWDRCSEKAHQPDLYKSSRHHSKEQRRRPQVRGRRHARAVPRRGRRRGRHSQAAL